MAQIGTIRLQTQNNGTVDVPVFNTGDSGSSVYEFVRVHTASGTGFIPVTDPADAQYPYLRVQSQNQGVVAVHNDAVTEVIVDGFEDGDISEYSGDTGIYSVVTDRTYSGSYALYDGGNNNKITSTSGLNAYPQPGDKFEIRTYHGDDEAGSSFGFGFDTNGNGNYAGYQGGNDDWFITNTDDGTSGGATVSDGTPQSQQWWRWVVEWYTDGTADFTVYDDSGNVIAGPMTYNNADVYTDTGIWFSDAHQSGDHDHWWDDYKIIGSV